MLLQRKQISECHVQAEHPLQSTASDPCAYSALPEPQLPCSGQQCAQQGGGSTAGEATVVSEL